MTSLKAIDSADFQLKSDGHVRFYAARFGNVDLVGDRILPGAFAKSLKAWRDSGDPIPIVFSHNWGDPFAIIGYVTDAREDSKGLLIEGVLDVKSNPTALQTFSLMQRRIVKEASFSYDVPPGGERKAKDGANNLVELDLLEVGPTLKGANPETSEAVKRAMKAHTAEWFAIDHEVTARALRAPTADEKAFDDEITEIERLRCVCGAYAPRERQEILGAVGQAAFPPFAQCSRCNRLQIPKSYTVDGRKYRVRTQEQADMWVRRIKRYRADGRYRAEIARSLFKDADEPDSKAVLAAARKQLAAWDNEPESEDDMVAREIEAMERMLYDR